MSYEERMAQEIVAKALGREVTQWDTGKQPSMYDFDIGTTGALEVTTIVDEDTRRALVRAAKNHSIRARNLHTSWVVMMRLPQDGNKVLIVDFRELVPRIEAALAALEAQGQAEMPKWDSLSKHLFCDASCPVRTLLGYGVTSARQAPQLDAKHGKPHIELSAMHGGTVPPDVNLVVDAIEHTLAKKQDSWEKLHVPGKSEREIFFWAASTERHTHRLIQEDRQPDRGPDVEKYGLTRVWVGAIGYWDTALHWTQEHGWQRYSHSS
ncbi:hypothetical protein [Saccharopolyspora hattusasensis]|uniref:hypothetical protein n=1 Tax=Saccharopolyspora hattusasensis TaxID=1128679 RepID=UPI003D95A559